MRFTPLTLSLALLLLSLLFCSCEGSERSPNELIISLPSDPISLDPILSTDLSSRIVIKYLYPSLFRYDESGKIVPSLAESYSLLPGSHPNTRTLRIKLVPRKISRDKLLNSQLVIDSLDRLRSESGPKQSSYSFIKGGRVVDQSTLDVFFSGGLRNALEKLALPQASIYCPEKVECGDYSLVEWKRNNYIRISKNEFQSDGKASVILFRVLPQASTGVFLYAKDQLDLMRLPNFLLGNRNVRRDRILARKGSGVQYVAIREGDPCFDRNFRYALNYAVDKREIIKVLLDDNAEVASGPFPSSVASDLFSRKQEEIFAYNRELAKEYLAKSACYPSILKRELEFRMRADEENQANGAAIVQYLREIGLQIKILPMEKAELYKENGERKGDLTLLFWYADFPGAWNFIDPLFASDRFGNAGNRAFYSNHKMDLLLQSARNSDKLDLGDSERSSWQILKEDAPWIFLWSPYELYLVGDRLWNSLESKSNLPSDLP
ncbi:peptide ABC transporter substrate-binding protein [Leptospira perolatii]|uniref:Peptide ABC transporter substrate-binding protein n=1 Tax=Leptospira perolatii TaxID=2023191 RepID=A0A2M9ZSM1_9LEPT|nr:ABC transporter substrate-binding protein [Leptospira perolatii]PJZ71389.1 peptide ABC transporter substrate-binding protein [Leptospira perolatii]PJZ74923.1 peptide ABC transporter substrate-binding protein [Leptospira perolatii]